MGYPYKKPDIDTFRAVAVSNGGMLSAIAKALDVTRQAVHKWVENDPDFKEIIREQRMVVVDECFSTARLLAKGKPIIDGKTFVGWEIPPDGNMIRFLLDRLGKEEGFGEEVKVDANVRVQGSVSIQSWLELNTQQLDTDNELED